MTDFDKERKTADINNIGKNRWYKGRRRPRQRSGQKYHDRPQ